MLPIRKRIKNPHRYYSLRKKIISLKKTSNGKSIFRGPEAVKKKNEYLNVITLFPNKA